MKSLLVVAAGMADLPHPALKGRTPLAETRTPNADRMAKEGRLAAAVFQPEETLSILGYDPAQVRPGLGALEAAGRGILPAAGEAVFLADFCTVASEKMVDAGVSLKPEEVRILCDLLNRELGRPEVRFVPGSGSRAFLLAFVDSLASVRCSTPAEVLDQAEALRGARAVYAKAWASPQYYGAPDAGLEARRQHWGWTVTEEKMALGDRAVFLHCLPVRRNVVVTDEVLDGPRSRVYLEAGNRLHTARAVLQRALGGFQP